MRMLAQRSKSQAGFDTKLGLPVGAGGANFDDAGSFTER